MGMCLSPCRPDPPMRSLLSDMASGAVARPPASPAGIGELIGWFRRECEVLVAPCDPTVLPLRLPKGRISDLLACERGAVAALGDVELSEALVRGRITDVLVAQHVTLGLTADVEADVRGGLAAGAVTDVLAWLERVTPEERARVWAHGEVVRQGLIEGWGDDRPVVVAPAPGAAVGYHGRRGRPCRVASAVDDRGPLLVLSAQFDLVLGGPPTGSRGS